MLKSLVEALKGYERWLDRRRRAKRKQTEDHARAIKSVLRSVSATRSYLYDLRTGGREDRGREARLSELWAEAAVDVHAVDRRLSRIAAVASQHWADPALLDHPEFSRVSAQLDVMQKQCEWILERA